MITDTELRVQGAKALTDTLGMVEAERYITLILREPFDYTAWRKNLFADRTLEEVHTAAQKSILEGEGKAFRPDGLN